MALKLRARTKSPLGVQTLDVGDLSDTGKLMVILNDLQQKIRDLQGRDKNIDMAGAKLTNVELDRVDVDLVSGIIPPHLLRFILCGGFHAFAASGTTALRFAQDLTDQQFDVYWQGTGSTSTALVTDAVWKIWRIRVSKITHTITVAQAAADKKWTEYKTLSYS